MTASRIMQFVLMLFVCVGFFTALFGLAIIVIPEQNAELAKAIIYQLTGAFITVINFAFGSSSGSQRKDELKELQ